MSWFFFTHTPLFLSAIDIHKQQINIIYTYNEKPSQQFSFAKTEKKCFFFISKIMHNN